MTLIYSRKAYHDDAEFASIVESTAMEANNLEHHIELINKYYPELTTVQLWTYEHSGMRIETFQRCSWDSSADAFAATDDHDELQTKLAEINEELE